MDKYETLHQILATAIQQEQAVPSRGEMAAAKLAAIAFKAGLAAFDDISQSSLLSGAARKAEAEYSANVRTEKLTMEERIFALEAGTRSSAQSGLAGVPRGFSGQSSAPVVAKGFFLPEQTQ